MALVRGTGAARNSIPVYHPGKIDADGIAQVAALSPAVIYSFYYRNLLPDAMLNALAPWVHTICTVRCCQNIAGARRSIGCS